MKRRGSSDLARKQEVMRKTGQDYANYFHAGVKLELCPEWLWKDSSVSDSIPLHAENGVHYAGDNAVAGEILDYLAVGEHLRWMGSHIAEGYKAGIEKREDIKTHPDIRPYYQLDEYAKHFDWVVVKTTLELLRKG